MRDDYSRKVKDKVLDELVSKNPKAYYVNLREALKRKQQDKILKEYEYEHAIKYINRANHVEEKPLALKK